MPFADNSHLHMISVMSFMQRIMHITFWENQQAKTQNNSNAANVMSPGCNADIIYATSPLRSISDIAISCSIVYHNKLWKYMLKVNEEKTITQTEKLRYNSLITTGYEMSFPVLTGTMTF